MEKKQFKDFKDFIREQGVVAFAVGFMLGGAVSGVTQSFVNDILNPFLSFVFPFSDNISNAYSMLGKNRISWGNFVSEIINFALLIFIVYFLIKKVGLEKLDKK